DLAAQSGAMHGAVFAGRIRRRRPRPRDRWHPHRRMRRLEGARFAITTPAAAIDATVAIVASARRRLSLRTRDLDPGLYDQPDVLSALRRFATRPHIAVQILLHEPEAVQRRGSAVVELARRLPGSFALRAVDDPVDRAFSGACLVNDAGGFHL